MHVVVTGASGLIGTALTSYLGERGHVVTSVARTPSSAGSARAFWDPTRGNPPTGLPDRFDALVHLAGAPIGEGRWTKRRKDLIRDSRVDSTRAVAQFLAERYPRVHLVVASAIGYYGSRGDEVLTEGSTHGDGFLSEVCQAWERAADPIRSVAGDATHLRTGIVLDARGGALARQLPLMRMGLGGTLGSGRQWWSMISLDDEIRAIEWVLANRVPGPVNLTGPEPATNREFTRTLGRLLGRPTFFTAPAFALKIALGKQRAEELVLASQRVIPSVLLENGFRFNNSDLSTLVRSALTP